MAIAFREPRKRIVSAQSLARFRDSQAFAEFVAFIERLNGAVRGKRITDVGPISPSVERIVSMLNSLLRWTDEIPPVDNAMSRFGNPAFRTFYDRVSTHIEELMQAAGVGPDAIVELGGYFKESFGNQQRIDYGTGHEANFMCWLLCLEKLGVVCADDYPAMVLAVFVKYMEVMRQLQLQYWLEPAGSHGVWGLDDYHFLPFLFGSSQLVGHKFVRPRAIRDKDIVDEMADDYLYFACIKFINSIKTCASLRWHSPMLDDISAVKTWDKVNSGMLKMYMAEVLNKLPIMQHFLFGSLIDFQDGHDDDENVDHRADACCSTSEFPSCCGIAVPSAVSVQRRPLPFD
ncbi:Serine/threonine-protein phosphatase 2A activator [Plasmodiophora brassicae]|uniref:Serine/threonine-protein phosphatase 2A activator n=1 Tax=Plasmodiophora brassicae TaxID=37360 RepID=A0A0G4J760_PLABS|nr:hypothetical protein PBRA_003212 [Plasmodiophora brassicae]SPQ95684.1 unnamed protein product [Plasmodiophora brassicae]